MNNQPTFRPAGSPRTAIVVACIAIFFVGIGVGRVISSTSDAGIALDRAIRTIAGLQPGNASVSDVVSLIQSKYVKRPVEPSVLLNGAIEGLVDSLRDPYSYYLNPSDAKTFDDELNGTFDGIGAELGIRDDRILVIAPLPDTPAERAGLRTGDVLLKIDGTPTDNMTLDDAVRRIRGPRGTDVVLVIVSGDEEPREIRVTRQNIQVKSVTLTFKEVEQGSIAVIAISNFSQTSASEFTKVRNDILLKQPAGIVLDLRNNSGGYLESAVNIAEEFIPDGAVVIEDYGNGKRETINADGDALLARFPLVVLINGGTASAAEILAGALEDRLNSKTIGEQSFGKGSVQELERLTDGSTLKLTVAHWLTPNGRSIDSEGLTPSVQVPLTADDVNADRDPQLDRALQTVTSK